MSTEFEKHWPCRWSLNSMIWPVPTSAVSNQSCFPNPFQPPGPPDGPAIILYLSQSVSWTLSGPAAIGLASFFKTPLKCLLLYKASQWPIPSSIPSLGHKLALGSFQQSLNHTVAVVTGLHACLHCLLKNTGQVARPARHGVSGSCPGTHEALHKYHLN